MTYSGTTTRWQPWAYRDPNWHMNDLTGYAIDALDGEIGKVDRDTYEMDNSYIVVDTGPWIFGRKVMLPAGVISGVDHESKRVFVDRTRDQIENAPEFDDSMISDVDYRDRLGTYYGNDGPGWYNPVR